MFELLGAEETMSGTGVATDAGAKFHDWTSEWVESMTLGKYTMIYGIMSWVLAIMPLVVHFFVNKTQSGQAFAMIVYIHQGVWWPVAMTHLALSLWDSEFMRRMFEIAIMMSISGPLMLYWVGFAHMWMRAGALMDSSTSAYAKTCREQAANNLCVQFWGDSPSDYLTDEAWNQYKDLTDITVNVWNDLVGR